MIKRTFRSCFLKSALCFNWSVVSVCRACLPKAAEKKHHYIAHELLTCECGQEHTQVSMDSH